MNVLFAQFRFPAPEFENYTLPEMPLEPSVWDTLPLRVCVLAVFLLVSGLCFYRFRSRGWLVATAVAGWAVFGYILGPCPCPVGMFQNLAESAVSGSPIPLSCLLLFALPLACALFWGRIFCTGACPLGAVQEILHWKSVAVPRALDRALRMAPVALLLLFAVMAANGMGYYLCRFDPWIPLFFWSFPLIPTVLAVCFVALGLFISRPFCRYVCPYGALLRLCALFSGVKPLLTGKTCIQCRLCEQGCPNGAVAPPEPAGTPHDQRRGTARLATLIACIPLALCVGGVLGFLAAPVVSGAHRDVRLLCDVLEKRPSKEAEAFEVSGASLEELRIRANRAEDRILLGMCVAGGVMATWVMIDLIAVARRRREEARYEIDASLCFCCGRCYSACPLNQRGNFTEEPDA